MIALYGEESEATISHVVLQMIHFANQSDAPIRLVISTYGGAVDEMFSLYDTIKFINAPVHTIVLGKVMSAGVLIAASGEKGQRIIGPTSRVMIHPVSGGAVGHIFDVENNVKEMRRMQEQMTRYLSTETGLTEKKLTKLMEEGKDHYLTAEEAVELGIVDKIMKQS
jgi:ATP-dependent Clp protease protease subunit